MPPFATLHTSTGFLHARVTKSLAAANLNNLEIHIPPNFIYGTTNKTPEYLAKFPHGKIPALETPSGFCVSEGSAIALYLAEAGPKKTQLTGRTPEERASVQMWVSLSDSELFPPAGAILLPILGIEAYDKERVDKREAEFIRALKRVEHHLNQEGKVWLVRDDELSLADLSVAASLFWPFQFFMDPDYRAEYPKVMQWWERLMAVEEVGKAFKVPVAMCEKRLPNDGSYGKSKGLDKE
ncbi:glutathione S-transferase [Polyplosphaeria fusca]|uniref:Glutathione S-transferase n=1 Tax=Polyplosphaeria fusca TaxID=682080 RepID=A0A9P4R9Z0_9PLEO|nr:glutathione S-transferase [Polyplosphaeria fusca]